MRNDIAYTSMMDFENVVNSYLSCQFDSFENGKAVFIADKNLQYRGADISCYNGIIIDSKIKNTNSINEIFDYPSVEISIKHG